MYSIEAEYQEWLACPAMPEELQEELRTMDGLQKNDSFYRELAFGTGGLRGVLGAECIYRAAGYPGAGYLSESVFSGSQLCREL